jgi:ABC-type Fe3+ transport system permease subunit
VGWKSLKNKVKWSEVKQSEVKRSKVKWMYCLWFCIVFMLCVCVMCVACLLYCCTTATGLKPNCSLANIYLKTFMWLLDSRFLRAI